MIDSDRLKIEEIRLQEKVNSPTLLEIRSDADDAEQRIGERNALTEQLSEKRLEIIKAMEKEDLEAQAAMARDANTDGWTPELREFHQLGQRTSILEYMQAGLQQRHLRSGTPEHEYNSHVFGGNWNVGDYPLEMLLDRGEYFNMEAQQAEQIREPELEQRTEITGVVATGGNLSFVDRIFATSEGAYCRGCSPP